MTLPAIFKPLLNWLFNGSNGNVNRNQYEFSKGLNVHDLSRFMPEQLGLTTQQTEAYEHPQLPKG